jgi:hypothetical protein
MLLDLEILKKYTDGFVSSLTLEVIQDVVGILGFGQSTLNNHSTMQLLSTVAKHLSPTHFLNVQLAQLPTSATITI